MSSFVRNQPQANHSMIPRIAKTSDRLPFPPGTPVVYWQVLSPTEAVKPADPFHGGSEIRGITQILTADDAATLTDMGGVHAAKEGDEVIVFLDGAGAKTNVYEQIHHIDPMEDEPQRWFAVGVDPNKAHADKS